MSHTFTNPVQYHLTKDRKIGNLLSDFNKIQDYLLTFVGDVGVKKERDGSIIISYQETPLKATLRTNSDPKIKDTVISQQITLTCEKEDNLSVNLIRNVTNNIGYRIFNPQTRSYLVNNPHLLDLTTTKVKANILKIFKQYKLKPFLQYRDNLVFFAKDKSGKIHLVNTYLLELLIENPQKDLHKKDFSIVVADDIGRFTALFDRGLIPPSFYQYQGGDKKIMNLSGFDINNLSKGIIINPILFQIDLSKQVYTQSEFAKIPQWIELKKDQSIVKEIEKRLKKAKMANYLVIKIAQDVGFVKRGNNLIPELKVLIFLDK